MPRRIGADKHGWGKRKLERLIRVTVNKREYVLTVTPNTTLADMLRLNLGLTGTKIGCNVGDCGACTVILDGKPVNSCLVLAVQADGKSILTIEGLGTEEKLDPIQEAFIEKGAIQCGFCTPGMVLVGKSLLERNPDADESEIRKAISGNLCRCTGYQKIVEAIKSVCKREP